MNQWHMQEDKWCIWPDETPLQKKLFDDLAALKKMTAFVCHRRRLAHEHDKRKQHLWHKGCGVLAAENYIHSQFLSAGHQLAQLETQWSREWTCHCCPGRWPQSRWWSGNRTGCPQLHSSRWLRSAFSACSNSSDVSSAPLLHPWRIQILLRTRHVLVLHYYNNKI